MSGVKVGTRLEHLEQLQRRIAQEIKVERLAAHRGQRPTVAVVAEKPARVVAPVITDGTLPPAAVIRAWAMENGYLPETQRTGPIPADVIELYREEGARL